MEHFYVAIIGGRFAGLAALKQLLNLGKQAVLSEAHLERPITKYILHATSKDKIFSIDLTRAHEYQSNFGYSVLLNKLNPWFAKQAAESAERQGGGIVSGVHVQSLSWQQQQQQQQQND